MAAAPVSCEEFLSLVRRAGIVPEATLASFSNLSGEPTACAAALIAKGHITKFQAKLLLNGRYKGFKLGPYIVRDQIGQGGMGAVYLAEHETLHRRVALKVLTMPKDSRDGPLAQERFLREARSAAALDHPNIVRLHDVGQNAGMHFLVMEYVDGQTLEELLQKGGPMPPSRAVGFIAQAAAGLQQAHEKGFVHRDIKPGNLMLAKDGTVKILDMGLARLTDDNAEKLTEVLDAGAVVGTADFISPEQAMNGRVDVRSDIYSLGATFFALVTGTPPFTGSTTQKLVQHQLKEAPSLATLDRTFPHGLAVVVSKMLEKRAENRYQTPAELIQALAGWLPAASGRKVAAGLSGAASEELSNTLSEIENTTQRFGTNTRLAVRKARQKRQMIWVAGAVGVLALGGVIGYLASPSQRVTPIASTAPITPPEDNPQPKPKPKVEPKGKGKDAPVPPKTAPKDRENLLVQLPLQSLQPFTLQLAHHDTPNKPGLKETYTGAGRLQPPWYKWIDQKDAQAEIVLVEGSAGKSIGLRMTSGSGGVSINSPEFTAPTEGSVKVTITYQTELSSPACVVRFRQTPSKKTWDVILLPKTNGEWKTITKDVDLQGSASGLFEIATSGVGEESTLRVSEFEVAR